MSKIITDVRDLLTDEDGSRNANYEAREEMLTAEVANHNADNDRISRLDVVLVNRFGLFDDVETYRLCIRRDAGEVYGVVDVAMSNLTLAELVAIRDVTALMVARREGAN